MELDARAKRRLARFKGSKSGKAWRRVIRDAVNSREEIPEGDGAATALLAMLTARWTVLRTLSRLS